ncbi:hypothetical protein ACSVDA_22150 [Cytobacillus sp. Hm23]
MDEYLKGTIVIIMLLFILLIIIQLDYRYTQDRIPTELSVSVNPDPIVNIRIAPVVNFTLEA